MKRVEGSRIEIKGLHHYDGGLFMNGEDTIEGAKKTIDESNARRIKDGWIKEPEQYLICCHEWYRYENDNGTFVEEQTITRVIEKYPIVFS